MNVRLRQDQSFLASYWCEDASSRFTLVTNLYDVEITMMTHSQDQREINVAVSRALYMIHEEFADTVFFDRNHDAVSRLFQDIGVNVTVLPGPPVDQIIGMMLYCKLQAVMEGRVIITNISIRSTRGNNVWYQHDHDEALGPFSADGWWHHSDVSHCEPQSTAEDVTMIPTNVWKTLDLDWPGSEQPNSKILYADFTKK